MRLYMSSSVRKDKEKGFQVKLNEGLAINLQYIKGGIVMTINKIDMIQAEKEIEKIRTEFEKKIANIQKVAKIFGIKNVPLPTWEEVQKEAIAQIAEKLAEK